MLAQLPTLPPGALENWLLSAAAVAVIIGAALKLIPRKTPSESEFVTREEFRLFRASVERELSGLRDRIDSRYLSVVEAIDKLRIDLLADEERRTAALQPRLTALESSVARLDERTK